MSYLARLKQLESGEIFQHTPKPEPTKPTKGASDGFVGSIPGAYENIHAENDANETRNQEEHLRWRVRFADREPVEVYCDPHETHAGILKCYPDALAAEPIPERIKRVFTEAENAEWEALWLGTPNTSCVSCTRSRKPGGVTRYCSARPDFPPAYGDGHPLRCLPDTEGAKCQQWEGRVKTSTRINARPLVKFSDNANPQNALKKDSGVLNE